MTPKQGAILLQEYRVKMARSSNWQNIRLFKSSVHISSMGFPPILTIHGFVSGVTERESIIRARWDSLLIVVCADVG